MQNILFVGLLGGISNLLIALLAIQALGRAYPHARLTVLTFPPGGTLLCEDPHIHTVVTAEQDAHSAVKHLLSTQTFDLIVSNTNHSGIEQLILQSGTPRIVMNLWRSPPPDQRVGERFLAILHEEGVIPLDAIVPPRLYLTYEERERARYRVMNGTDLRIFLIPDAGMPIKRWPETYFAALGSALLRQYDANLVIVEGNDARQAGRIARAIGGRVQLWKRGDLRDLAAAVSFADLVVAADTGLAHIAALLDIPTITLFGPSWHARHGQPSPHINLQGYPACPERVITDFTEQRCWYAGICPLGMWRTCLEAITPAEVLAAAHTLLVPACQQRSYQCAL